MNTVDNVAPVASFDFVFVIGFFVSVDSTSTDSDGYVDTYSWTWGYATTGDATSSATHDYTAQGPGTYTITLKVTD